MPYNFRKLPNKNLYRVYNTKTKEVHSYGTTLENAKKQIKLLNMVDAGVPLKKELQGGSVKNPILLEMFKGTGSVGKQANKMGFNVTSLDFDPIYTPDIETDILDWDYKKYSKENNYIPDMIWSSPPCNTYSPMVYRLKERDVETAKPLSDRAKLGTKILYKTLEIIEYFLKKNPKLLFIIENPRGMMRKDKEMKKLARETTLYCLYGDFKRKPTDFWNNFPNGLGIDQETKQCPGKTILVQNLRTIEERYSMPAKFIKHFLEEFKKQYSHPLEKGNPKERMTKRLAMPLERVEVSIGGSIETDKFDERGIVSLPEFRSVNINLPTYMYKRLPDIKGKPPAYRYRLVIPITSSRNLSSRKKETSLNINQKPVSKPIVDIIESEIEPNLNEFSPADRLKIQTYYNKVKQNERLNPNEVDKDDYEIIPRGRPLPCEGANNRKAEPKKRKKIELIIKEEPKKSKNLSKEVKILSKEPKNLGKEGSFLENLQEQLKEEPILSDDERREREFKKLRRQEEIIAEQNKKRKVREKLLDMKRRLDKLPEGEKKTKLQIEFDNLKEGKGLLSKNKILSNNNKKMANPWIAYVKSYAAKNGMSYRDALRCPKCKAGYKKGGKVGMGVVDEIGNQDLLAEMYNDSELGANAGKKYISL